MSPNVWLTVLFVVLTVTGYLLWVLAIPTAGEHAIGWARPQAATV